MRRPSRTAPTMVAKLSSSSTMCAASRATSVPMRPMATPMSARAQRGRVVHAVAGHRHDLAALLQRPDDPDLVLGRHARVHPHVAHPLAQRLTRECGQLRPGQHRPVSVVDPQAAGDGSRGGGVVAGDHHRRMPAVRHVATALARLLARRVQQPHQPQERAAPAPTSAAVRGERGKVPHRHRQHAQAPRRHPLRRPQRLVRVKRHAAAVRRQPVHAPRQHPLRRALGERHCAVGPRCSVVIRARSEEKGTSATRGSRTSSSARRYPAAAAARYSATSVGSPSGSPSAPAAASLLSASASSSDASHAVRRNRAAGVDRPSTRMRFW